jgi:hypothetical protein
MENMRMNRVSKFLLVVTALVAVVVALARPDLSKTAAGALFGLGGGIAAFGTLQTDSDIVRQLAAWRVLDAAGGVLLRFRIKTADYVIVSPATAAGDPSGTIFTNRGAVAAVVFTLPAPTQAIAGVFYEFLGIADFAMTVATATADTLICLNDIAADSLASSTATKLIGGKFRAECDGTSWIAYGVAAGGTYTVAT